ncbi:Serine/threonine/tyrosine-protein kinase HT1 [Linum perenne]
MRKLLWLKQQSSYNHEEKKPEAGRTLSLGEYRSAISWSKYLVTSGAEIKLKGEGDQEWSADMSQLFIGNKFASGKHSRIYRGIYKQRDVAIKLISQPLEDEDLASFLEKQFSSEVALLFQLCHHPNIITVSIHSTLFFLFSLLLFLQFLFVAACKKPPVFCIITEYLAGGSLKKYLHHQEPYSLPITLVLKLALDIAHGMQYLHSQGILHRDLKSENLLLDMDMSVKVADFGISCLESQCGTPKGFTGTYRWMAPEMIKEKHHTKKVDVYSFGIVMWELFTALTPFDNMTPEQAAFAVSQKNARPPLPVTCPTAFSHLINRCWSSNPGKRPHFDEIVAILESYSESLSRNPDFFSKYKPKHEHGTLGRFGKCIAVRPSKSHLSFPS